MQNLQRQWDDGDRSGNAAESKIRPTGGCEYISIMVVHRSLVATDSFMQRNPSFSFAAVGL